MAGNNLRLCTWNSRGHRYDRLEYMQKLMNKCDLLFVQEHWYLDADINKIAQHINDVEVVGVSGMDESQLILGRPYGGCAIIYRNSLNGTVSLITTQSRRLCAAILSLPGNVNILLCNVYMPCDMQHDQHDEYLTILCEIDSIMSVNGSCDYVVLGGDFNTDMVRLQSAHTRSLTAFCSQSGMAMCINHGISCVEYTYENDFSGARSVIDHFILSENLFAGVSEYYSLHDGDNTSDHQPVLLHLPVRTECIDRPPMSRQSTKTKWETASQNDLNAYKNELQAKLADITLPRNAIDCQDLKCSQHLEEIQRYYDDILQACISAADCTVGRRQNRTRNLPRRPGWNNYVQPYKERAIFWHALWKCNGSPREGHIALIRRQTRARYRYAVRYIKRHEEQCRANRLAEGLLSNNGRDAWHEVRKVTARKGGVPTSIDDIDGDREIGELFAQKTSAVFNSVSYNAESMNEIIQDLNRDIALKCAHPDQCYHSHRVTQESVADALKTMKAGKGDGTEEFSSDFLRNGPNALVVHLSLLFDSILRHGTFPHEFALSTVIPIPKCRKKSLKSSSNYRTIALGSIVAKLFDITILNSNKRVLKCSDYQYGFRKAHSTVQCTFVLNETIQYYLNGGSTVHVMLLDATKAFDRVEFVKLFSVLRSKGLCSVVCRILASMYVAQQFRVRWQSETSDWHAASNGVKQGGVISPMLFVNYVDELLRRLSCSGVGCFVGHVFCGSFGYADDVTLLAPSPHALSVMLRICREYAEEFSMLFNPDKSKYVVFNKNKHVRLPDQFEWNGTEIKRCESDVHLGNVIGLKSGEQCVRESVLDFYSRFNHFVYNFKRVPLDVKYRLFKTICMSVYGSQLWEYSSRVCEQFFVAWRKAIRRLCNISPRTHNHLLPLIVNDLPIDTQLHKRFINFFVKALHSDNRCTQLCAELALQGSGSSVANSCRFICTKYSIDVNHLHSKCPSALMKKLYRASDEAHQVDADFIRDFIEFRDTCCSFDFHNCNFILTYMCTR